jgi:serine/threonine protein kinase/CRP-like cAMP-binding protein
VERFGRYQLIQPIARGGMAEILLARPLSGARRHCAVKRILPAYSQDLKFVSMFIDEARITIGLQHPHIVRLDDFGQVDGTYFMAMEYVDGTDLAALLRVHVLRGEGLPPIVAAAIVRDVADGLAHAHALRDPHGQPLGVVHRDVSPQNVLLSTTGEVKVTDFGIAAARNKLSLTTPGMVLGKAAYMAPEQARGEPVDFRVDLWALGVVLWECLVGDRLFSGKTAVDTLEAVLTAPIPAPSTLRPGIPVALDSLTATLLAREPAERPARTDDVVRALDAVIAGLAKASPLARRGRFDASALADFLAAIDWSEDTTPLRPGVPRAPVASPKDITQKRAAGLFDDPVLKGLMGRLRDEQEPWLLVDLGDRAVALGHTDLALSAWRSAAAGFASRGLLVQALAAHAPVRAIVGEDEATRDVMALGDLEPGNADELVDLLRRFDRHGLGLAVISTTLPLPPKVPLLSDLGPRELARVAGVVGVRRVKAGDVIIREGERGDVLYALARGRLVVSCSPGDLRSVTGPAGDDDPDWAADVTARDEGGVRLDALLLQHQHSRRVYLGGLADGDFFGEFSFLAERPRSATVEAVTDAVLLEFEREDVEHIAAVDPAFTAPLLGFYKERVVELMMAKSPIFSLLPPEDRRHLLDGARSVDVKDSELIVREGTTDDSLWFIRRGEVEVFRADPHGAIFINKLGAGQFFGEIAALRGTPRTVSVRAIGTTSLFCIEGRALQAAVASDARLKQLMNTVIARRSAELRERVLEHHRVFFDT